MAVTRPEASSATVQFGGASTVVVYVSSLLASILAWNVAGPPGATVEFAGEACKVKKDPLPSSSTRSLVGDTEVTVIGPS